MFIQLKREIITECGIEDLKIVADSTENKNYWTKIDKENRDGFIKRHLTRVDGLIDELLREDGKAAVTYKESTTLDEDRLKADHPTAFETCSEKKLNPKALELFYPDLAKQYRKPAFRSLKIA